MPITHHFGRADQKTGGVAPKPIFNGRLSLLRCQSESFIFTMHEPI